MPTRKEDLPGTIKRSPAKAQRTNAKALDSAHDVPGRSRMTKTERAQAIGRRQD